MATRFSATVVGFGLLGACSGRQSPGPDADAASTCEPVAAERGQCRPPLEASFCAATWGARPPPMCGLRVYEGPGAGYLLQYVSYADIPPIGGPSWMCIYDRETQVLVGVWALDHYLRWCCGSSLDLFEGVASNEIANLAYSMVTHPPCLDAGGEAPPAE